MIEGSDSENMAGDALEAFKKTLISPLTYARRLDEQIKPYSLWQKALIAGGVGVGSVMPAILLERIMSGDELGIGIGLVVVMPIIGTFISTELVVNLMHTPYYQSGEK